MPDSLVKSVQDLVQRWEPLAAALLAAAYFGRRWIGDHMPATNARIVELTKSVNRVHDRIDEIERRARETETKQARIEGVCSAIRRSSDRATG